MTADVAAVTALACLLSCSGVFSASETALFSLGPGDRMAIDGATDRLSKLVRHLLGISKQALLTILVFNNAINIAYFAVAGWWAATTQHQATIGISALAALLLVGEIVPKVIASGNPLMLARLFAAPLYIATIVATPVNFLVQKFLGRWLEEDIAPHPEETVTAEELQLVIRDSHQHGVVSELVHDRMMEVIKLSDTPIYKVMTHRVDCPTITTATNNEEAIGVLRESPSPFLLVVDSDTEDCVGIITPQDLLKGGKVSKRMRKPMFIPEGSLLPKAIEMFQQSSKQYAVVLDEYGGTAGVITLAHLGNALLGSGLHEDLPNLPEPEQVAPNKWRVSGLTPLDGWEDLLGIEKLDELEFSTVGGFITHTLGAIPDTGARLLVGNLLFEVVATDDRIISLVTVEQLSSDEARRLTAVMGTGAS